MFRLSKLQFSCTVLQYSFDKRLLKFYKLFAERLGLKVEKRDDTLFVVGDCLDLELSEHKGEYMISYNIWDEFPCNETIDYIKHMFLTKDVWADISINLFNPLPRYISGVDFSLGDYDTYWIFAIITRDCNLSCPYCYELKRKDYIETKRLIKFVEKTRKEIKKRRKKTLLDREKKIGVTIGGGEPTLHSEFVTIVKKLRKIVDYLTVSSNGTNISKLLEVSDYVDGVAISAPFIYDDDLMRRLHPIPKERIEDAVKELAGSVKNLCITVIVTSKMRPRHVRELVDYARGLGATHVLFTLFKPLGDGAKFRNLVPDLWLARDILIEIARCSLDIKDVELLIDSCFAKYTAYQICPTHGKLITPGLFEFRICPQRTIEEPCVFDWLYLYYIYEFIAEKAQKNNK